MNPGNENLFVEHFMMNMKEISFNILVFICIKYKQIPARRITVFFYCGGFVKCFMQTEYTDFTILRLLKKRIVHFVIT